MPINDLVDAAVDDAVLHHVLVRDLIVGLIPVRFEHIEPLAPLHFRAHLLIIELIRAFLVITAITRGTLSSS